MNSLSAFLAVIVCSIVHTKSYGHTKTDCMRIEVGAVIDTIVKPTQINAEAISCVTYNDEYEERHIQELLSFLAIRSISSLPSHDTDMVRAADWLSQKLKSIGMVSTQIVPTNGHPVVVSHWNNAKGKPTVLIYGHYDVQPVNENEWDSPPFTGKSQNGRIYGRGAADDKGGILIPVWAVENILKKTGSLPVNVIFVFDGEEEIGSPHFVEFLQKHKHELQADFAYNADAVQYNDSIPAIWMSLRGSVALEFTVKTADIDAHSGIYGGKIPNAAKAAAQIIASFYGPDNKIAIQGFYDRVLPVTPTERESVNKVPYDLGKDKKDLGTTTETGEEDFSPLERTWYRPTLEVTGMWSGYTASEGFANIIPGSAHVRLNCRLVANQNGQEIVLLLKKHIAKHCPKGATVIYKEVRAHAAPIKFSSTEASFKHAYETLTKIYDRPPLLTAVGGSIAALTHIKEILGLNAYSFGFQQTDENFHAPNEFIRLSDIKKGQKAYCMLLMSIGNAGIKKERLAK